jgi:hypothetical protein
LMLDRWVLRTKERPIGHKLFLPQEVVWREVWTKGFKKKTQLQMMISMEKYVINYSPKWVGVVYFSIAICGS